MGRRVIGMCRAYKAVSVVHPEKSDVVELKRDELEQCFIGSGADGVNRRRASVTGNIFIGKSERSMRKLRLDPR